MEAIKCPTVKCSIHKNDNVSRVDTQLHTDKELYCIECLLISSDPKAIVPRLKSIDEFFQSAQKFYKDLESNNSSSYSVPDQVLEIQNRRQELIEELSIKLEDEKKTIHTEFELLINDVLELLSKKRHEYINHLEDQITNFNLNFEYLEKQVQKLNGNESEQTIESLMEKLNNIETAEELKNLIKLVKMDMSEAKILPNENPQEKRLENLNKLVEKLREHSEKPPKIKVSNTLEKPKKDFERAVDDLLRSVFVLENDIPENLVNDFPRSEILKESDFIMLQKFLDEPYKQKKWKLLFRGSLHGHKGVKFHEFCDNKGPTVSVAKSGFGKIFGGFCDEPWKGRDQYVNTKNTFIFSVTEKKKYSYIDPNTHSQYGVCDNKTYGPTFGGGHDFHIAPDWKSNANYSRRYSYDFPDNVTLTGGYNFTVEEVEVYLLE